MYPAAVILIIACCVALFAVGNSIELLELFEVGHCHAEPDGALLGICTEF